MENTDCLKKFNCCAIIPAFNESNLIGDVVSQVRQHANEVLVIDDGSIDNTSEKARSAGASIIRHNNNLGKGHALSKGIQYAADNGFEIVVTLDADGQHDPAEIPKLILALDNGADIVIGSRMHKPEGMPFERRYTNMIMSTIISILTKARLRDSQCGFKAFRLNKILELNLGTCRFDWESELLIKAARRGFRLREVGINCIYNDTQKSKIKVFPDTLRFVKLILSNIVY